MPSILPHAFSKRFAVLCLLKPDAKNHARRFFERYPTGKKECNACNAEHSIFKFRVRDTEKGLLKPTCIKANRDYGKAHYKAKKKEIILKVKKHKDRQIAENREVALSHLKQCKCALCKQPWAEESPSARNLRYFLPRGSRQQTVNMAVNGGLSKIAVKKAIDRSTILCEDCLSQRSAELLNELWANRRLASENNPGAVVASCFKKDVYRCYRRVNSKPQSPLPITQEQASHLSVLTQLNEIGQEIVLIGKMSEFDKCLAKSKKISPDKESKKSIKRFRKKLTNELRTEKGDNRAY